MVGFINECCEPFEVTDVALDTDSFAVRRICKVVAGMDIGRLLRMFDVELDLFTELIFSRITVGTDLALSDCLSASFLANISLDRALRKLLRTTGFVVAAAPGVNCRSFGWLSRGELTELVEDRRPFCVTDDGDELVEFDWAVDNALVVIVSFLLTALRAANDCFSFAGMINTFSLFTFVLGVRCVGFLASASFALRSSKCTNDSCDLVSSVFNELRNESPNESIDRSYSLHETPLAALVRRFALAGEARLSRDIEIDSMTVGFLLTGAINSLRRVVITGLVVLELSLDEMLRCRSGRFV